MEEKDPRLKEEIAKRRKLSALQPIWIGVMLVLGIYIGSNLREGNVFEQRTINIESPSKLVNIINYIEENYVDTVEKKRLIETAIGAVLEELDPHSYYISPEELAAMQEPLQGNFEGIGVEFMIQRDTLMVVTPIEGGPSEEAGIQPGDRIVEVDDELIAGTDLTNQRVMELLKGPKGTEVKLGIERKNNKDLIQFTIIRDKIPIESIVAALMVDPETAYVKVTRFARTTYEEFVAAVDGLVQQGAKKLVLDLRGNGGGYLNTAIPMVESFLKEGQLIVYTEGVNSKRREYHALRTGSFADMELVVLINQGSASASEIMAGALQDHDRAVTVGRRSFGKGLVQDEIDLRDNSALRLTVARYYTPSGRCIQKPYGEGIDYGSDYEERYHNGELLNPDSIDFADSLKYTTAGGRVVYGGGGIMPDIFVPLDTVGSSMYFSELSYSGIIRQFGFEYTDKNRASMNYVNVQEFVDRFKVNDGLFQELIDYATEQGVEAQEYGVKNSREGIALRLKAHIAKNLFDGNAFYQVLLQDDPDIRQAVGAFEREEVLTLIPENK